MIDERNGVLVPADADFAEAAIAYLRNMMLADTQATRRPKGSVPRCSPTSRLNADAPRPFWRARWRISATAPTDRGSGKGGSDIGQMS
jgi:hypothetical protein